MTTKNNTQKNLGPDRGDVFNQEKLPEKIGKNLRQMYDDVLSEPVPDDFLSLLQKADAKQPSE